MTYDATKLPAVSSVGGIQETPEDLGEPISLQQAKAHLRVVFNDEDDYIAGLITAARQMAEGRLNRSLVRKTIQVIYDADDASYGLRKPPVVQIIGVSTVDQYGQATALVPTDFRAAGLGDDVSLQAARGATWPSTIAQGSSLLVEYEAGYAAGQVPKPIIQWMLLCIGTMYENRETMAAGVQIYAMPEDFMRWLLQPYMVYE